MPTIKHRKQHWVKSCLKGKITFLGEHLTCAENVELSYMKCDSFEVITLRGSSSHKKRLCLDALVDSPS